MTEEKVYILEIKRTPVGKFLGGLSNLSSVELGSQLLKKMLGKYPQIKDSVDEVIIGNVLSAGQGQNVSRQIAINAGIKTSIPAYSVNMVCGSGLKAIYEAFVHIKAGEADCVIAGGVESMSNAPFVTKNNLRVGSKMGNIELQDTILRDGLTDAFKEIHMGITAENLSEMYDISREEQDMFSMDSQLKARNAQESGVFNKEIIPISIKTPKNEYEISEDEYINYSTSIDKMGKLRAAFKKEGTITAGNSSGINDGGAFAFVVSESFLEKNNLTPLVEILSFGQSGVDPNIMGIGPVEAIRKNLDKSEISLDDIDVFELNEAFASQSISVLKELSKDTKQEHDKFMKKVNPYGGAIALGHPIGASGARISTTLIHNMISNGHTYGLASLCIGGGMGISMIVKQ